jgi:hypothetical protein
MFQSSKSLMQAVLDVIDDMLVGAPDPEPECDAVAPHPHQRTVRLRVRRRDGSVTARQMHCASPVRACAQPTRESVR